MKLTTVSMLFVAAMFAGSVGCAQDVSDASETTDSEVRVASDASIEREITTQGAATEYTTESDDTFHFVKVTGPKRINAAAVRALLKTAGTDVTNQLGCSVDAAEVKVEDFDFTTPPEDGEDMAMAALTDLMRSKLSGLKAYVIAQHLSPVGDHGGYVFMFVGRSPSGTMMAVYAKGAAT